MILLQFVLPKIYLLVQLVQMYCQVTKHLICPSHCSLKNIISVLPSGQNKNTKRDKLEHNNQNFQQGIKQTQDFLLKIGEQDWFQLLFMCAKYENSTANRTIDVWNLYLWTHFVILQCFIGKTKRGVHRRRLKTLTTFVLLLVVEHSNLAHAEVVESTVFITFQWNPSNQNFCFLTWSVFFLCLSIFLLFSDLVADMLMLNIILSPAAHYPQGLSSWLLWVPKCTHFMYVYCLYYHVRVANYKWIPYFSPQS